MDGPSPETIALLRQIGDNVGRAVRPVTLDVELNRAVSAVRQLYAAGACSVALLEGDGSQLRFRAADGAGAEVIVGISLPLGRGVAGWVAMTAQAIAVTDVQRDPRFAKDVAEATSYVPRSLIAVPLVDDVGSVSGVLEVLDPEHGEDHTGRDLDVLGLIGSQLAAVVRLCQLYDALGETLVRALAGWPDEEGFAAALGELARERPPVDELAVMADTFRELADSGPDARRLARQVLAEVLAFVRGRR
jgi:signal transduction protein with GAF and PtsI domain